MRRVVVTGIGAVTPLGCGVKTTWKRLLAGHSAAATVKSFDASHLATNYACEIPLGNDDGEFNPEHWMEPRELRKVDNFILYAIAAADMAISDSGWVAGSVSERHRTGVIVGSGIGGLSTIASTALLIRDRGARRVSPFFIPGSLVNLASGQISIRHGFKGPNHAVATACATGAHAIGDAARMIGRGDADVMVAGGTESPISEIGLAGFNACRALSTRWRDTPERASRPFDSDRDGFVMGEGAGVVVLEELDHAVSRDAKIYAEVVGYGLSGDASHITMPSEDGDGGYRAMSMAMADAQRAPGDIDYVNAHGTSTAADTIELSAIERLLGDSLASVTISSTKSSIGHLLGAAGAVEAIFSIMAICKQVVPPTINLDCPAVDSRFDLAPLKSRKRKVDLALSNSFGFGGSNACLVFAGIGT